MKQNKFNRFFLFFYIIFFNLTLFADVFEIHEIKNEGCYSKKLVTEKILCNSSSKKIFFSSSNNLKKIFDFIQDNIVLKPRKCYMGKFVSLMIVNQNTLKRISVASNNIIIVNGNKYLKNKNLVKQLIRAVKSEKLKIDTQKVCQKIKYKNFNGKIKFKISPNKNEKRIPLLKKKVLTYLIRVEVSLIGCLSINNNVKITLRHSKGSIKILKSNKKIEKELKQCLNNNSLKRLNLYFSQDPFFTKVKSFTVEFFASCE